MFISLVVPVYNEEATIEAFLARALPAVDEARRLLGPSAPFEIVFVDDGSTDATPAVLAAARRRVPEIQVVSLSRNFGKDAAVAAGLRHARGRAVVPIDVDLQDPPEVIPEMVAKWLAGAQVVSGVRRNRRGDSTAKKITAGCFYRVYNLIAERSIPSEVGDFRLLDRQVVDVLNTLPERSRFMKGLFSWVGFRQDEVHFVREERAAGTTKWRYWRLWNFALDGLTSSTTAPLRVWSYIGLAVACIALLCGVSLVVATLMSGNEVPGYPSLMTTVLFLGGLNLLSLGIMGEYVGRIALEVRGRPLYVVRSVNGSHPGNEREERDEQWNLPSTQEWPRTRHATGGSQAAEPSFKRSSRES